MPTGLVVDREMIVDIIDDLDNDIVKGTEADVILLTARGSTVETPEAEVNDSLEKVEKTATKQAIRKITK